VLRIWRLIQHPFSRWLGAVIVAALGIYGAFIYERTADVAIEVVSSTSVLDARASLDKLAIVYDGTDLRAAKQDLRLLVVGIANRGSANLSKASFDDSTPFGFSVNAGKIVDLPALDADAYLKATLKPTVRDERTVTFSPAPLNAGASFRVSALVLVPENGGALTVSPVGKIAGVKRVVTLASDSGQQSASYWSKAFSGTPPIQIGRMVGYFVATLICFAVLNFVYVRPIGALLENFRKWRRKRRVGRYRQAAGRPLSLKEEYLAAQYIDQTLTFDTFVAAVFPELVYDGSLASRSHRRRLKEAYEELAQNGLIVDDGSKVELETDFEQPAREFIDFVTPTRSKRDATVTEAPQA
jgi:hypothetical protein